MTVDAYLSGFSRGVETRSTRPSMAQELRVFGGLCRSVAGSIFAQEYFYPTVLRKVTVCIIRFFVFCASLFSVLVSFCTLFSDIAAPVADIFVDPSLNFSVIKIVVTISSFFTYNFLHNIKKCFNIMNNTYITLNFENISNDIVTIVKKIIAAQTILEFDDKLLMCDR